MIENLASERSLSDVIAHAPFGVVRIGAEMTILDANPRFARLFLAEAGEMIGSSISKYFSPDEAGWVIHQLGTLSPSLDEVQSESHGLRADGSGIWLAWSATAIRKSDWEIAYYIAMFEDRTAKHQAEVTAARNLNILERLSTLKTEFLTTVSHELRTALVGIQGFSELMRDAESLDISEVRLFADEVYREAQRLDLMVTKMLEIDQAPGSRTIPHITNVDLNTTVHEVVAGGSPEESRHRVVVDLAPVIPTVKGDPALLRQVVSILLGNALKFSPKESAVVVSSRVAFDEVQITVKDHGSGMPEDFDPRLFGRSRSDANNPAIAVVGNGLSLPIARQIVELHGGRIWFDTATGVGSEFHFTIPTVAKPEARSETQ